MSARTKWLLLAPAGLMLMGAGLCVLTGAGYEMQTGAPFMRWFIKGTYSLILFNGGASVFGTAIRFRVMIDTRQIIRQELKRNYKKYAKPKKAPSQRRDEAKGKEV